MSTEFIFRRTTPEDVPQILEFIKEHGFTERSPESWQAEHMQAALALCGQEIIGVIPFALRQLKINDGVYARAGHVSAVAVAEEFRSQGIGSQLVDFLKTNYSDELDCVVVNRDDHQGTDRAYQWYAKNGFIDAVDVRCLYAQASELPVSTLAAQRVSVVQIDEATLTAIEYAQLRTLFDHTFAGVGGFEKRDEHFWRRRFQHHYYKKLNTYYLLRMDTGDELTAYAIFGKNFIHQPEGKVDIFEYGQDRRQASAAQLVGAVADFCRSAKIPLIRFVMGKEMPLYEELLRLDFKDVTGFKFMVLPLRPGVLNEEKLWTFLSFDYI